MATIEARANADFGGIDASAKAIRIIEARAEAVWDLRFPASDDEQEKGE